MDEGLKGLGGFIVSIRRIIFSLSSGNQMELRSWGCLVALDGYFIYFIHSSLFQ